MQGGQRWTGLTEGERPGRERIGAFWSLPLADWPGPTSQSLPQEGAERPTQKSIYLIGPSFA